MKMKLDGEAILKKFYDMKTNVKGNLSVSMLRMFVNNHFKHHTFDNWVPPDFRNYPPIIDNIQDYNYKQVFQ